jgi:hypothetical protein
MGLIVLLVAVLFGGLSLRFLADQSRNMGDASPVVGMVDGVGQLVMFLGFIVAVMLTLL